MLVDEDFYENLMKSFDFDLISFFNKSYLGMQFFLHEIYLRPLTIIS